MNNKDIPTALSPNCEAMRLPIKGLRAWLDRKFRDDSTTNGDAGWEEYWKVRRVMEILDFVEKMDG